MTNTIAFNTGRTYTEHGQRIAAKRLDCGAIIMLDIDRHIDVLFSPDTDFTQAAIMWDYDRNICAGSPNSIGLDYSDYYAILADLREVANQVASV